MVDAPTVFVVDDDDSVRDSMKYLLESERLRVQAFDSAAAFLKDVPEDVPGCVVCDVRMPGMNGYEFHQTLLNGARRIPLILVTAYADVPNAVGSVKKGAFDYLEKPVDGDVLIRCVKNALRHDAQERKEAANRLVFEERLQRLTPREREVFESMVKGTSSREIAGEMGLSHKTIESHRSHILRKMEVGSVSELIHLSLSTQASSNTESEPSQQRTEDRPGRVGVFGSA